MGHSGQSLRLGLRHEPDVDTFLSESGRAEFSYRLLVATTDRIGKTALRTLEAQEKPAGLRLRADLERAEGRVARVSQRPAAPTSHAQAPAPSSTGSPRRGVRGLCGEQKRPTRHGLWHWQDSGGSLGDGATIGLAKTARDYDLRRIDHFHGRVKKARDFARSFPSVVSWMPEAERLSGAVGADYVSGDIPSGQREVKLARLSENWSRESAV